MAVIRNRDRPSTESPARVVLLHALPFDGRMWQAERDLVALGAMAPTLYRLGESLEDWARGVLDLVGSEPIMVISGDQDRTPSPATAAGQLVTASNRRFHLVEDCGHYVSLERPAEFRELVTRAAKKRGTSV